uniref:Uncharacterized protein n=1 Tax=Nelumbo nucifera TaxID=4432 RepID=A0A822XSI5_NELNU|nr:TPA_asm: hypothetical protein HUJ06_024126 [Nelumbo nucifera]
MHLHAVRDLKLHKPIYQDGHYLCYVVVYLEALFYNWVQSDDHYPVGPGLACWPTCQKTLEELLQVLNPVKDALRLHLTDRSGAQGRRCLGLFAGDFFSSCLTPAALTLHSKLDPLIKVQRIGSHKGGVVPGVGVAAIPEVRQVEKPGAPTGGEEDLFLVGGVALQEEPMYQDECLERHRPVLSLVETFREHVNAGANVSSGVASKVDDLSDVLLLGRLLIVPCGLHDRDVEVGQGVAVDLG